jgi:hypothetical protein
LYCCSEAVTIPADSIFHAGNFEWGGVNFSESADNISFSIEGGDSVPVLRAGLRDVEGNVQWRDLNLAERIGNIDGNFEFSKWIILATRNTQELHC